MSKKLFVGGLDWNTNDQSLAQAFAGFGTVSEAKVIMDRETGRSRGFGFVTFQDNAEAQAAIAGMDGQSIDGRTVRVNEAQEKSGGGGGGGRGGGGGGGGFGGAVAGASVADLNAFMAAAKAAHIFVRAGERAH